MKNKAVNDKYELLMDNLLVIMKLRKKRKIDLSELSNINYSQLSRYLNRHNEIPLRVFIELCEALQVTLSELENYHEDSPPPSTVKKDLADIKKMIEEMSQITEKEKKK